MKSVSGSAARLKVAVAEPRASIAGAAACLRPRIATAVAVLIVAWVLFLTVKRAVFAQSRHYLTVLTPHHDLAPFLALTGIALVIGLLVLARKRAFAPVVPIGLALTCALVLSITSSSLGAVLAAAAVAGWCYVVGEALLTVIESGRTASGCGPAAMSTALGLGALSYAILLLSLPGLISDLSLAALMVLTPIVAGAYLLRRRARSTAHVETPDDAEAKSGLEVVEYLALVFIVVSLLLTFLISLAPQVEFDALLYHLAVPRVLLHEGRYVERLDIQGSYYPMGMEFTYVPPIWLGGEAD